MLRDLFGRPLEGVMESARLRPRSVLERPFSSARRVRVLTERFVGVGSAGKGLSVKDGLDCVVWSASAPICGLGSPKPLETCMSSTSSIDPL